MLFAIFKNIWLLIIFYFSFFKKFCCHLVKKEKKVRNRKLQVCLGTSTDVSPRRVRQCIKLARRTNSTMPLMITQRDVEWSDLLDEKLVVAEQRLKNVPCNRDHFYDFFRSNTTPIPTPKNFPNFNSWVLELFDIANRNPRIQILSRPGPMTVGHRRYNFDGSDSEEEYYYVEE